MFTHHQVAGWLGPCRPLPWSCRRVWPGRTVTRRASPASHVRQPGPDFGHVTGTFQPVLASSLKDGEWNEVLQAPVLPVPVSKERD